MRHRGGRTPIRPRLAAEMAAALTRRAAARQEGEMEHAFDELTKVIAASGSRRDMLRRLGATALGVALASVGVSCEPDRTSGPRPARPLLDARGRCKRVEQKCREDSECCSGFCDPFSGICACPSGNVACPASGQCITACQPPFVLT